MKRVLTFDGTFYGRNAKNWTEMDDYFAEHLLFLEKLQIVLQTQDEKGLEWINTTIDKYQENPALLDPHLTKINTPLVQAIKKLDGANSVPFKILYSICKTRGYKTILKFYSHSVSDLEPVLVQMDSIFRRANFIFCLGIFLQNHDLLDKNLNEPLQTQEFICRRFSSTINKKYSSNI